MIIKELHIDGFGVFNDLSLTLPGKGIQVILGNNEAGKSTLLRFIRHVIFGNKINLVEALNGGNQGGRLKVLLASGREVIFGRMGKKQQLIIDGQDQNPEQWPALLGYASEALFQNVYAFTLDELRDMKSLADSGMEDKIFSLGMGLGRISISSVETGIRNAMDKIFRVNGRGETLISRLVKEIQEKNSQIISIQGNMEVYRQLVNDIALLCGEIDHCAQKLKALRNESSRIDAFLKCYESFILYKNAEAELALLPPLKEYPENGIQRYEHFKEAQRDTEARAGLIMNGGKGERGIDELRNMLEDQQVNTDLLAQKEMVDFVRLNLAGYQQVVSQLAHDRHEVQELNDSIRAIITGKISSSWSGQDVMAFKDEAAHLGKVDNLNEALHTVTEEKRNWEAHERAVLATASGFDASRIAVVASVVFLLLSLPLLLSGMYIWGASVLAVSGVFFAGRNAFRKEDKITPVKNKLKELEEQQKHILANYHQWLKKELKLPEDLSFPALRSVIHDIGEARKQIVKRDARIKSIQENLLPVAVDYEVKTKSLRQYLENAPAGEDLKLLAHAIISEYDAAVKQTAGKELLSQELKHKLEEYKRLSDELNRCREASNKLIAATGAQSVAEFYTRYRENEKVAHLLQVKKSAMETIETVAGLNKASEVTEFLTLHEKQDLQAQLEELAAQIKTGEVYFAELNTQRGAKTTERDRISGESELADKLTELGMLRKQLKDAYKDWMACRIAVKVLSGVRARYEKERQPAVIQNSAASFSAITGGKYTGIRTSLDDRELRIYDQREASVKLDQMSRGTREQLLISLRLGFIEEYEKNSEPLPLVVDEILVNSDPDRAKHTAAVLEQFAQHRQVLIFTCHPSTIDLFQNPHVIGISEGKLKA
jgi:uncharacterized protein YhaN